jgi:large repetitive protein
MYSWFGTTRSGLNSRRLTAGMLLLCFPAASWGLTITGFSPGFGRPGNVITINGSGFTGATNVAFNKNAPTLGDFTIVSDSQLLVVVPQGAGSGPLQVSAGGVSASSTADFLVAPVISAFYPQSGANPTAVSILGSNFIENGTSVIFPGVTNRVTATYVGPTEVEAVVPVGASNGPITVITSAGTNVSATNFLASPLPSISAFAPTTGAAGASVTIFGGNFLSGSKVKFGSASSASVSVVSTTEITATVPTGATTDPITVTTSQGSTITTSNFYTGTGPIITDFSPTLGGYYTPVTIDGLNLSTATRVTVNGVSESITGQTPLQITLTNNPGTGPIEVVTPLGSAVTSTNFTNSAGPLVTDFYPVLGPAGSRVTIDGLNFTGATSVKFGATDASFDVTAATQISATVPSISLGNYDLEVISSLGSDTTSSNFIVTGAAPIITSFTPTNGVRGTSVTLNGADFTNLDSPAVKFNGVAASTQPVTTTTELVATVPADATTGLITAANASGTGASPSFFYLQPWITALSTNGGIVNASFTMTGRSLTNTASVQVGGVNYTFSNSASQIVATIPSNAVSGQIEITTPGGIFILTSTFAILPKIYGFSPDLGPAGTLVTISGTSLFDVTSVEFNGVAAAVSSATSNQAQVVVPASATAGPLTVVTPYGNDSSTNSFTVTKPSTVLLTKTVNPAVAAPGANITYLLQVTNEGPSIITAAVVTDALPVGFTVASAAASAGSWINTNFTLTWSIGILTNNHSVHLQIVGTCQVALALTNSAVLAFAEGNLVPYDNYASIVNFFVYDYQRTLSITLQGKPPEVLVTWPFSPADFLLQINTNADLNIGWTNPFSAVFTSNDLNAFTNRLTAPHTFFRLAPP